MVKCEYCSVLAYILSMLKDLHNIVQTTRQGNIGQAKSLCPDLEAATTGSETVYNFLVNDMPW